jgi:neutral ceramidase
VDRTLPSLAPISGPLRAAYAVVDLPFAPAPGRADWHARRQSPDQYVRRHAGLMLEALDRDGQLPVVQAEPVQVWRFGRDLTLVALGGEVVVDYALRLKRDHPGERLWVAAYSNDVFGYVPSRRVLQEGGYEGGGAMIYYGKPGPFAPEVEELIHGKVRELMGGRP